MTTPKKKSAAIPPWLPVRLDINSEAEVLTIAHLTGLDRFGVVGRLIELWAWANRTTTDGNARGDVLGVTFKLLDDFICSPGFAQAMFTAGWLNVVGREESTDPPQPGETLSFPNFDRWNSQGARNRLVAARRMAAYRDRERKCYAGGVTQGATPDATDGATDGATNLSPRERERERVKTQDPPTPRGAGGGAGEGPGHEFVELPDFGLLVEAWTAAGLAGAGKVQATSNRKGHWQQRHADPYWAANWRAAVERAGRSERCRPGGGWALALDTFLKDPDLVRRLLEGEFDTTAEGGIPRPGAVRDVTEEFRRKHLAPKT